MKNISQQSPSEPARYLGLFPTLTGCWKNQIGRLKTQLHTLLNTTPAKAATLAESRHLIGTVAHASLIFRTTAMPLSPATLNALDSTCIHTLQRRSLFSSTSSMWLWPAPAEVGGGDYDSLYRKTLTAQLTNLTL